MVELEPFIDVSSLRITKEQAARLRAHLALTWRLGACRTCTTSAYELIAQKNMHFTSDPHTLVDSENGVDRPCAALVCMSCGEVRFIDLTVAGVYPRPEEPVAPRGPYR